MLGSLHDADDALQETLLRAWHGIDRYEPRAPLRAWLYRIATNVCLTMIDRRRRQPHSTTGQAAWAGELIHLEPYPDQLLDELEEPSPGPEAQTATREHVELAFITAVQLLPPKQRAALILRDVLGWSAKEAATALADTVPAVNSALQRARAGVERAQGLELGAPGHRPAPGAERELLHRFMDAWDRVDIDGIVQLLTHDALLAMPPAPGEVTGAEAIGAFLASVPAHGRLDQIRLVQTAANNQPGLAAYVRDPTDGIHRAYGIMVLAIERHRISGIVGCADPSLFPPFGLPAELHP